MVFSYIVYDKFPKTVLAYTVYRNVSWHFYSPFFQVKKRFKISLYTMMSQLWYMHINDVLQRKLKITSRYFYTKTINVGGRVSLPRHLLTKVITLLISLLGVQHNITRGQFISTVSNDDNW